MKFNKEAMASSAMNGFTNATDAADYLVGKGVPFRDAHGIVGRLVLYCIEKDTCIPYLPAYPYCRQAESLSLLSGLPSRRHRPVRFFHGLVRRYPDFLKKVLHTYKGYMDNSWLKGKKI